MSAFRINPRSSVVSLGLTAVLAVPAAAQVGGTNADIEPSTDKSAIYRRDTGINDSGNYNQEVQACLSGRSAQARETCLEEARNARAAQRRGELSKGKEDFRANALARCQPLSGEYKAACEARVMGFGTASGSVAGGGLLREVETVVLPPGEDRVRIEAQTSNPVVLVPSSTSGSSAMGAGAQSTGSAGTDAASQRSASEKSASEKGASGAATQQRGGSAASVDAAAVLVLLPLQLASDEKLANGCWVRFYDGRNFSGSTLTLAGPVDMPRMYPAGSVWRDWESAVVGPKARVTTFDNENFRERTASLAPGQRIADLRDKKLGWFDEVHSARVACTS